MIVDSDITLSQLERLLEIVETKENRNWNWLYDWLDGRYRVGQLGDPEFVIHLYKEDKPWD